MEDQDITPNIYMLFKITDILAEQTNSRILHIPFQLFDLFLNYLFELLENIGNILSDILLQSCLVQQQVKDRLSIFFYLFLCHINMP